MPQESNEDTIEARRDVRSATIVGSPVGHILEVHVGALPGRNPKQIARDVESMIVAKLGMPIDHRKISVAQVDEDAGVSRAGTASAR